MAHVVTLREHPSDNTVVYLCTPPDMATVMGGFGPARYVGNNPPVQGASYVITSEDLPRFRVYCTNRHVHVIDGRGTTTERPYGRGAPLPECAHCGQPAQRGHNPHHCPNCGAPWDPIEVGNPYARSHTPTMQCPHGHHTPQGFTHCTVCGTPHAQP